MRIGEYLVQKGVLTLRQVDEIMAHSRATGKRFGEAGLDLRILSEDALKRVLGKSFRVDFFHADPSYLPLEGRDIYSREQIARWGMIPLGFRMEHQFFRARRMLSVGFIDPSRLDALDQADRIARERLGPTGIHGIRPWLVVPEHFWNTVRQAFQLTPEWVLSLAAADVDPTLAEYVRAQNTQARSDRALNAA
jgi:hypothetical protein